MANKDSLFLVNVPSEPRGTKLFVVGIDGSFLGTTISSVGINVNDDTTKAVVLSLDVNVADANDTRSDVIEIVLMIAALVAVASVAKLTHCDF